MDSMGQKRRRADGKASPFKQEDLGKKKKKKLAKKGDCRYSPGKKRKQRMPLGAFREKKNSSNPQRNGYPSGWRKRARTNISSRKGKYHLELEAQRKTGPLVQGPNWGRRQAELGGGVKRKGSLDQLPSLLGVGGFGAQKRYKKLRRRISATGTIGKAAVKKGEKDK